MKKVHPPEGRRGGCDIPWLGEGSRAERGIEPQPFLGGCGRTSRPRLRELRLSGNPSGEPALRRFIWRVAPGELPRRAREGYDEGAEGPADGAPPVSSCLPGGAKFGSCEETLGADSRACPWGRSDRRCNLPAAGAEDAVAGLTWAGREALVAASGHFRWSAWMTYGDGCHGVTFLRDRDSSGAVPARTRPAHSPDAGGPAHSGPCYTTVNVLAYEGVRRGAVNAACHICTTRSFGGSSRAARTAGRDIRRIRYSRTRGAVPKNRFENSYYLGRNTNCVAIRRVWNKFMLRPLEMPSTSVNSKARGFQAGSDVRERVFYGYPQDGHSHTREEHRQSH